MSASRYVVLHHTGIDQPHYDLMFEWDSRRPLGCMRCSNWPPTNGAAFERLADHRREYLEYEGPVSDNRGEVKRVEAGTCTVEVDREDSILLTLCTGMRVRVPARSVR